MSVCACVASAGQLCLQPVPHDQSGQGAAATRGAGVQSRVPRAGPNRGWANGDDDADDDDDDDDVGDLILIFFRYATLEICDIYTLGGPHHWFSGQRAVATGLRVIEKTPPTQPPHIRADEGDDDMGTVWGTACSPVRRATPT